MIDNNPQSGIPLTSLVAAAISLLVTLTLLLVGGVFRGY